MQLFRQLFYSAKNLHKDLHCGPSSLPLKSAITELKCTLGYYLTNHASVILVAHHTTLSLTAPPPDALLLLCLSRRRLLARCCCSHLRHPSWRLLEFVNERQLNNCLFLLAVINQLYTYCTRVLKRPRCTTMVCKKGDGTAPPTETQWSVPHKNYIKDGEAKRKKKAPPV